jgi:hypothetical protein
MVVIAKMAAVNTTAAAVSSEREEVFKPEFSCEGVEMDSLVKKILPS